MILHVALATLLWAGTTLLLTAAVWPARPIGDARIARYLPGSHEAPSTAGRLGPLGTWSSVAEALGDRVAGLLGIDDDLAQRLQRLHDARTPGQVRRQQVALAGVTLGLATAALTVIQAAPVPAAVVALSAPALVFWVHEQRSKARSRARQRRVLLELPTVAEQLGLLLGAGYSTATALGRIAAHSEGAIAEDLDRVTQRIRHGLDHHAALAEWARIADVPAIERLVKVLALDRAGGDVGRLIAEEARAVRMEVHRQVLAEVRRRSQQVWVPVTVAALLPGAIFLAVPFLRAIDLYTSP